MPWKKSNPLSGLSRILVLPVVFALAGCAGKPWTSQLEGDRYNEASRLMDTLAAENSACGGTLEGDLGLVYTSALEKKALNGFLEFSQPSAYKFVVTNPFGQPLFAAAGDHVSYQAINVSERLYMAGSMRSFGIRHKLPPGILSESWGEWIMARNTHGSGAITAIHEDKEARGLWITYRHDEKEPTGQSHLLVDPAETKILARILEDKDGETVAEVTYDDWQDQGKCRQPQEVNVTGLKYGTEIRLKFANVRVTDEEKRFQLPVPPGYMKQLMP
ncbi:MAG TPA: hypothetical protein DDY32_12990 [Desulfobulbaceae bacterium]|nr:hypothetical protein [Desulfobulbaceae bacterium]